jgi:hypothetical protein
MIERVSIDEIAAIEPAPESFLDAADAKGASPRRHAGLPPNMMIHDKELVTATKLARH